MTERPAGSAERPAAPRRSVLAVTAFLVGLAPTGCGQLVAPVLALMAWLEIRSSQRPLRGRGLALAAVVVSAAWLGAYGWLAQLTMQQHQQERREQRVVRDLHATECIARLRRIAEGLAVARASDRWTLDQLREDEVPAWLVDQGYVAPEDCCCPAAAGDFSGDGVPPITVRYLQPLPPHVLPPQRCIVLFEDRARHPKERGQGRHVLYADGHVDWLVAGEFGDAVESQQKAAAAASRK